MATDLNFRNFINRVRGLFNVDGYLLEDVMSLEHQVEFVKDPVRYFINIADHKQQQAIWREVQKRAIPWDTFGVEEQQ